MQFRRSDIGLGGNSSQKHHHKLPKFKFISTAVAIQHPEQGTVKAALLFSGSWSMFFLSPRCLLCDRSCDGFGSVQVRLCLTCERQICAAKRDQPLGTMSDNSTMPLFTWADYEGNLRQSIARLKYHRMRTIGTWLGQQMADAWIAQDLHRTERRLVVVPIPMFAAKEKIRGYNQAAVIALAKSRSSAFGDTSIVQWTGASFLHNPPT